MAITKVEAPAQTAGSHPLSPAVATTPPASAATTRPMPSTNPAPPPQAPAAPAGTTSPAAPATAPPAAAAHAPGHLLIPVAGVAANQLQDTFGDGRGGGERAHEALDIMAPRGTPVLAASDGKLEKLFTSVPGGLTIYQFDPTRTYAYYYAHLDRYAPGIAEGSQLKRGELIGYVGSTGNASEDAPHLHFAVFVLGPEKRWWQGTAIDPYPLLGGR
ncbi:M23 family metallopeptidase [Cognatiluteimonas sedimenti]